MDKFVELYSVNGPIDFLDADVVYYCCSATMSRSAKGHNNNNMPGVGTTLLESMMQARNQARNDKSSSSLSAQSHKDTVTVTDRYKGAEKHAKNGHEREIEKRDSHSQGQAQPSTSTSSTSQKHDKDRTKDKEPQSDSLVNKPKEQTSAGSNRTKVKDPVNEDVLTQLRKDIAKLTGAVTNIGTDVSDLKTKYCTVT